MFRGSWKIARLAGIDIFVHWSFGLIFVWVLFQELAAGAGIVAASQLMLLVAALFVCVVMHEYGHALTARRFGIRTREITLLPIGGVARLERMPEDPKQELLVALAGPAVNVVIALVLFGVLFVMVGISGITDISQITSLLSESTGGFLFKLMFMNLFLVGFNMIPAFPMDGGRVLRAVLAFWMGHLRATEIAAKVGRLFAFALGIYAIWVWQPFLLILAFFIYIAGRQEAHAVRMKQIITGVKVQDVMVTNIRTLTTLTRLSDLVQQITPGELQDFPVLNGDHLEGMLFRLQIMQALDEGKQDQNIGSVMSREFATADPDELLEAAILRMQESQAETLPVLKADQLVGLLNINHINQWIMLQRARSMAGKLAEHLRNHAARAGAAPTQGA